MLEVYAKHSRERLAKDLGNYTGNEITRGLGINIKTNRLICLLSLYITGIFYKKLRSGDSRQFLKLSGHFLAKSFLYAS